MTSFIIELRERQVETVVNTWAALHRGTKARVGRAGALHDRNETGVTTLRESQVAVHTFFEHAVQYAHGSDLARSRAEDRQGGEGSRGFTKDHRVALHLAAPHDLAGFEVLAFPGLRSDGPPEELVVVTAKDFIRSRRLKIVDSSWQISARGDRTGHDRAFTERGPYHLVAHGLKTCDDLVEALDTHDDGVVTVRLRFTTVSG
jgi:hypothetical protein